MDGAVLTVAVPAEGDVEPAGPLRLLPDEPTPADELLAEAWTGADLLVTLAPLDPALGGDIDLGPQHRAGDVGSVAGQPDPATGEMMWRAELASPRRCWRRRQGREPG